MLKSYKMTLLPETKTIIVSVINWIKFGFIRREKYGIYFIPDIFEGDVYEEYKNLQLNIFYLLKNDTFWNCSTLTFF